MEGNEGKIERVMWSGTMEEADERDRAYWLAKTPAERLLELERLRELNYNYGKGKPLPRFQAILRVVEQGAG